MALSANKVKMVRQRLFIPYTQFGITTDATNVLETMSDSAAVVTETAAANVGGILFDAGGEDANTLQMIPTNLDRDNPVYVSVVWGASGTSGTATWIVTYLPRETNASTGEPPADPTTALNTVITAADAVSGVANGLQKTAQGVINGSSIADDDDYIMFKVELDAVATISSATFYGLELEYTPKFYKGHIVEAPAFQHDN